MKYKYIGKEVVISAIDSINSSRKIQSLNDTIAHLHYKLDDQIELIKKVDEFYDQAWSKVMWFILAGSAIVSVLLPYVVNLLQKRDLEHFKEKLSSELSDKLRLEFDSRIQTLNQIIQNQIDLQILNSDEKIKEVSALIDSKTIEFDEKTTKLKSLQDAYYTLTSAQIYTQKKNYRYASLYSIMATKMFISNTYTDKDVNPYINIGLMLVEHSLKNLKTKGKTSDIIKALRKLIPKLEEFINNCRNAEYFIDIKSLKMSEQKLEFLKEFCEEKILDDNENQ